MGIAPYKYFTYDGESSRDYDVYLTGEGVFNAPERAVEMLEIPGRNGNYALDQGKFNNISVTYKAGIVDVSESNFADKVSAVRNWLCSKVGYKRLSDDYNPNEYRMAVFKSGVNIDHVDLKTGEFEITFDCKPQRWLTSGETATAVTSGGTVTNPTLFEAKPVINFQGYGDIVLSGQTIAVEQITVGKVLLANGKRTSIEYPIGSVSPLSEVTSYTIDTSSLNTGDDIVLGLSSFTYTITATYYYDQMLEATATSQTGTGVSTIATIQTDKTASFYTEFEPITFKNGTSKTVSTTYSMHYEYGTDGGRTSSTSNKTIQIEYDGSNKITLSANLVNSSGSSTAFGSCTLGTVTGYSTVSASGDITIDLDTGESYWIKNNKRISADNSIRMGARLPVLVPGNNTITYDNTITNFKITPNWWRV